MLNYSDYQYHIDEYGDAIITKHHFTSDIEDIVIPAQLDGHTVKGIGKNAFSPLRIYRTKEKQQ